jgi:polysaccharide chain length determinant protein (PEP-CTERM system associated)
MIIQERISALLREFHQHRVKVLLGFAAISLLILAIGVAIPKKYVTRAVLYADFKNVIKPLLEGNAAVTEVDQAQVAKETINTRRLIETVAREAGVINDSMSRTERERALAKMSADIEVFSKGRNYIEISYDHSNQDVSYEVVDSLVTVFIKESSETKRKESSEAFNFIDGQVKAYKKQLKQAEDRLKAFQANNRDGTEATVNDRIADLRADIERLKLDIDDATTRMRSIDRQLADEGKYVQRQRQSDAVRVRLAQAKKNLDAMLLSFTDTHPDVVSLRQQIAEMERSIQNAEVQGISALGTSGGKTTILNPLYEELRKQRADAKVAQQTTRKRLVATESLLQKEYDRLKRIIERQAELAELTRDYDVTKNIYEDLLGRKEKARMSMTLDREGQGVSYKIQEPPVYPILPSGLRLMHFFFLGPFLGLMVPLGLLYLFIEFDPRVRMASIVEEKMKLPVLAVIPHTEQPGGKNSARSGSAMQWLILLSVVAVYVGVAIQKLVFAA